SQAAIAQLQLRETVYFCPVAREPLTGAANTVAGSAFNCWGPAGNPSGGLMGSYMFNGWLYRQGVATSASDSQALTWATGNGGTPGWSNAQALAAFWDLPIAAGASTSNVPVLADGVWVDGWCHASDSAPASVLKGDK